MRVRRRARPRRAENFSLIRLIRGGICNTDLELLRGYYAFRGRPGHEFVGEVVESDQKNLVGKRVVGEINLSCNACEWCRRELGRHCPHRTVLGIVRQPGAFAEFLTLPDRNLHVVPKEIPDDHAVFVEPLAAACQILEQVRMPKGLPVAVLGAGKLGLLISQVLHHHGAKVCQFGRNRNKLRVAASLGIATEVAARRVPQAAFDFVVDATGSAEGLRIATRMVKPLGIIILKSTVHGAVLLDSAPMVVNEVTLVGSRCGRFEPAIRLLRSGKVRVDPLLSDEYPLDRAGDAFTRAAERGVLKVLLRNA